MPSPALMTGISRCRAIRCGAPALGMADDDHVRAHRAQGVAGVEQRLAFFDARSAGEHQGGHGAQRLGSNFEGTAGAGGGLVKKQQDALAAQQGARLERIHPPGQLQQAQNVLRCRDVQSRAGNREQLGSCCQQYRLADRCLETSYRRSRNGDESSHLIDRSRLLRPAELCLRRPLRAAALR